MPTDIPPGRDMLLSGGRPVTMVCIFCQPADDDALARLTSSLRRLRNDPREAARIDQIAAEIDAATRAERGTHT
jgi:hypothetical protein